MSTNLVEYETHSGTAVIRFNRPDKKNALNQAMYKNMNHYLDMASTDDKIIAVILTGHEDFFTAGNDIQDFVLTKTIEDFTIVSEFIFKLANYAKPLIAAVNGLCIGIGTTLLLHCDLIYAGTNTTFHMPFSQLGLTPEAGSSYLLPAMMGHQKATQYLLLGEPFDANTALNFGLVNEVVNKQDVLPLALKKAALLSRYSPSSLITTKKLLKRHHQDPVMVTIKHELPLFFKQLQQPFTQKILQSFLNKPNQD